MLVERQLPRREATRLYDMLCDVRRTHHSLYEVARNAAALAMTPELAGLRSFVAQQISVERAPYFIIRQIPVDDSEATPSEVVPQNDEVPRFNDCAALILSALAGQVFALPEVQHGNFVSDIYPRKLSSGLAIGSGSTVRFDWHTDNAYLCHSGDFFTLLCIRNPDGVPTHVSTPDVSSIAARHYALLREPVFTLLPNRLGVFADEGVTNQPIFWGNVAYPYMRINMNYEMCVNIDPSYAEAVGALREHLSQNAEAVCLAPGDLLFVDNLRSAHSRPSFVARYAPMDRLLKRVYVDTAWRYNAPYRRDPHCLIVQSRRLGERWD